MPVRDSSPLFKKLGAPLNNTRWSWGAVRPTDGNVILRIWADEMGQIGKRIPASSAYPPNTFVCYLGIPDRYNPNLRNLGWNERKKHIKLLEEGAQGWGIQCKAKPDKKTGVIPDGSRTIETADNLSIWKFGEVFLERDPYGGDKDYWVTLIERSKFSTIMTDKLQ